MIKRFTEEKSAGARSGKSRSDKEEHRHDRIRDGESREERKKPRPEEKASESRDAEEDESMEDKPLISPGELAELTVSAVTNIGAFLHIGTEKELLLPFAEQTRDLKPGDRVFVACYTDKSGRPCSSMRVERFLEQESHFHKGDLVKGTVYEASEMGLFTAVENRYFGLVAASEAAGRTSLGPVEARVLRVRPDGKLDLSLREKLSERLSGEGDELLRLLKEHGGKLGINDHSSPEEIKAMTGMSKKEFKRSVGHLLKQGKLKITETGIEAK